MSASEQSFHPLADIFPLMEGEEFDALVADIKANGLREPIVLLGGQVLDGRNRYRACKAAGISPKFRPYNSTSPLAYVISANIHRRHLTAEKKGELIAKLVKARPEKSDRQIAKTAKVSPTFVGKVRAKAEATGDVSTVDTRIDTKGRKQPAKKGWSQERYKRHRAKKRGLADEGVEKLHEKLRTAEIKIAGLEAEIEDLKRENADLREKLAQPSNDMNACLAAPVDPADDIFADAVGLDPKADQLETESAA